jgi:hypothetical protein
VANDLLDVLGRDAEPAGALRLDGIDLAPLDTSTKIDLVRAYELALIRLGETSADTKARIAARFAPLFPSGSFDLDRELSSLLVAVRAPGIVPKLVGMLSAPSGSAGSTNIAPNEDDLRQLIARNAGSGGAVRAALEKRSDLLQVHYAYALRTVAEKDAWSLADRKGYHDWFQRAQQWAGGNSFRKFLVNIENESLVGYSDTEKLALETLGARKPYTPPPLPKPGAQPLLKGVCGLLSAESAPASSGRRRGCGGGQSHSGVNSAGVAPPSAVSVWAVCCRRAGRRAGGCGQSVGAWAVSAGVAPSSGA